jgi:hypothetical protein
MDGGAHCSGVATVTVTYNQTVTGGAHGGGDATVAEIGAAISMSGGAFVAGTATVAKIGTTISMSGGAFGSSTTTITARYNPTVTGGTHGTGSVTVTARYNPSVTDGTLASGEAIIEGNGDIFIVSAGVNGSGNATAVATYNPAFSGGAHDSGDAVVAVIVTSISISGGVFAAGTATVNHVAASNDRRARVSWARLIVPKRAPQTFNEFGSGGVYVLGTASPYTIRTIVVSDGVFVNGKAIVNTPQMIEEMTGTFDVSGTARTRVISLFVYNPSGDLIVVGGQIDLLYGFRHIATGGIELDSNNSYRNSFVINMSGKVVMGGSGKNAAGQYSKAWNGNIVMDGMASVHITIKCPITCPKILVPCVVKECTLDEDCPSMDFYEEKMFYRKPTRPRGQGAYLPAITKCRQPKLTKDRRIKRIAV